MFVYRYSVLVFCLAVSVGCSRSARFDRYDDQLEDSIARLDSLVSGVIGSYEAFPDRIDILFEGYCCDDTFARIDSLCLQQHDQLLRMADCCPRKLRRRLVLRAWQCADLRRLADAAENPFIYKSFGPLTSGSN